MAFNARWEFENLAEELGIPTDKLLASFRRDLEASVKRCPTYQLGVSVSGNYFTLTASDGSNYEPQSEAGLYAIFSREALVYFGEATDLKRRQMFDPDNTADSTRHFSNQGRAIVKLLLHRGWISRVRLTQLFIQLYPGSARVNDGSFEEGYRVTKYSKAVEGAASLFAHTLHSAMVARAQAQGYKL